MKCAIGIDAAFYRGYLIDDRNLTPHVALLATLVALWSLVYLVGCFALVAAKPNAEVAAQWSSLAAERLAP
jgi:ABC-type glucose/galactose transport system permease subunit